MGLGTKLAIFGRRLKDASLRRMNQNIQAIHQETGKNRLFLLCDMVWCTLRYGVGYLDYHVFGFARNRGANRKTFMTTGGLQRTVSFGWRKPSGSIRRSPACVPKASTPCGW